MTKERIKELLLSRDRELRLLGLSYLNENKNSPDLCLISIGNWSYSLNSKYIVDSTNNVQGLTKTFEILYNTIISSNYTEISDDSYMKNLSNMLTPYINYCYK